MSVLLLISEIAVPLAPELLPFVLKQGKSGEHCHAQ